MTSILERAQQWADDDCDESTREELLTLIKAKDEVQLKELVDGDLTFGTAGLRAKVGPGSLRMNRAVIRRTTRAVAEDLLATHPDARSLPVIVGYDGRLSSREFAEDTVGVLTACGLQVRYFTEPVATPIVAYALRRYGATAAIVITASHNPAEYNGYKLYASNGAQIISPKDAQIQERILKVPPADEIKVIQGAMDGSTALAEPVSDTVLEAYFHDIGALAPLRTVRRDLRIVYTPMHGVGYAPVKRALENAKFSELHVVESQAQPDGHFPTVSFPNPEEEGALDQALELAKNTDAELILANDPDADRLAVCVPIEKGQWLQLTGNQVGLLLADQLLRNYHGTDRALVACSIVSSPMLARVAEHYKAAHTETFTGFKWVWNAALELREQEHVHFVFGFEEALGYSAEDIVRDKDGISAALLFAELAAELDGAGSSVPARLQELYERHGLWVSLQKSLVRPGSQGQKEIAESMQRLADNPPTELEGVPVTQVVDFSQGGADRPRWLRNDKLLQFTLGGDDSSQAGRVLIRPSGTEPKIKIYVDLCRPLDGKAWRDAEKDVLAEAERLASAVQAAAGL